ncbi:hypothetical protein D1AOALGA4SA_6172 [Olavius algarvensis Delta 1 endosymbiont]|nr:hypothetical protein D1AOALGA4SA_6172 [Olavius algarvensis Delta 1 endosymbiont]
MSFSSNGLFKTTERSDSIIRHSSIDIRHSNVSHERGRWPRASSLIGKETAPNIRSFR